MKTNTSALVAAAALAASLAHGAIVPDADTILYVNCDTDYKFGENLATAADKLTCLHRKNDRLVTENPVGAYIRNGITGTPTANGGYFYVNGAGPAVTWQSNGYTSGDFTFEIFMRADSDASLDYLVNHTGGAWRLQYDGNKQLVFKKNWTGLGTSAALNDGVWHHIAVVQDKTAGTLSYYVDYQLVSRSNETTENDSSSDRLIIGAYTWDGQYNYNLQASKCAYDEVRLVKRALSPLEFLHTRTYPVDSDTVAYMSFDSTTAAKYDIDLGTSKLGCGARGRGSYTRNVDTSDKAAASLYQEARSTDTYADSGALLIDLGDGANNGNSGAGYVFSDPNHLVGTKSFTAEVFAKFTRLPENYWGYVFFQREMWILFVDGYGHLGCRVVRPTGNDTSTGTVSLIDDTWHHIAVVYDATLGTYSFYFDYSLFHRFTDVSFADSAHNGKFAFGGSEDDSNNNWSMSGGVNGALYDELRITKRALKPTEFITPESIAGVDPTMHARFEDGYGAMATGRYAVAGVASATGAGISTSAKVSREILNADKQVLFANTNGVALSGGTVAYPGNGVFDLEAATAEFFVKATAGGAGDSVVSFAATGAANPVWRLSANGAFAFNTASDDLAANLSIADGGWHHVAVAYAPVGADTAVSVYLDHALAATQTLSGAPAFGSGAGFTLGSAGFSGTIDELRLREGARGVSDMLYSTPPSATVLLMK